MGRHTAFLYDFLEAISVLLDIGSEIIVEERSAEQMKEWTAQIIKRICMVGIACSLLVGTLPETNAADTVENISAAVYTFEKKSDYPISGPDSARDKTQRRSVFHSPEVCPQ